MVLYTKAFIYKSATKENIKVGKGSKKSTIREYVLALHVWSEMRYLVTPSVAVRH